MLTGQFSACVHISYSGVCYNGSNDVRVIRDCIADYYDKGGAVGGISIPSEVVKHLDNSAFKIGVLVIWVAICVFVFDYTKFGRRENL